MNENEDILTLTREQLAELKKRFQHGSMIQGDSYVRISDDRMKAWLYLAEPVENGGYVVEQLIEMLKEKGVMKGYLESRLIAMAKKGVYEREVLVAQGREVSKGEDGYYEYYFNPEDMSSAPKIREDGSTDYSSMSALQNVKRGDLIAEYHMAVPGEDGYQVDGQVLKSRNVRELQPLRGLSINREGNLYYAGTTGKIECKEGKIDIRSVHEVSGDVDLSIGKIEFFGDITINGSVTAGVVIRSGRNIIIEGTVESAFLYAGGDIVLKRGVQGNMKGKIRARGNVYANFIEQCDVSAEKQVNANYILNANVTAGEYVKVNGKQGSIIGGKVSGFLGVSAVNLGNSVEVRTLIHAGYEQDVYNKLQGCVVRRKEIASELESILEEMEMLIRNKNARKNQGIRSGIMELNSKKDECYKELDSIESDIKIYEERVRKGRGSKIYAEGNTYKGVILDIEGCSRVMKTELQYAVYRKMDGEVRAEPYYPMAEEEDRKVKEP